MPFALLLIGAVLIVAGIRNKLTDLGSLLVGDFSGANNFFYWMAGIAAIGSLGYYKPMQETSRLFLALVVLSMLLADQGFFTQLVAALQSVKAPTPATETDVGKATTDTQSGGGGILGTIAKAAGQVALDTVIVA